MNVFKTVAAQAAAVKMRDQRPLRDNTASWLLQLPQYDRIDAGRQPHGRSRLDPSRCRRVSRLPQCLDCTVAERVERRSAAEIKESRPWPCCRRPDPGADCSA